MKKNNEIYAKIDRKSIIFNEKDNSMDKSLNELDKQFADWDDNEKTKEGKI